MTDNYVVIKKWMIDNLGLKGNELMIYSVIYGFSQDGESTFNGSQKYLAEWCGATTRTVRNALESLLERGLIEKIEFKRNGMLMVSYRVNLSYGKNTDNEEQSIEEHDEEIIEQTLDESAPEDEDVSDFLPPEKFSYPRKIETQTIGKNFLPQEKISADEEKFSDNNIVIITKERKIYKKKEKPDNLDEQQDSDEVKRFKKPSLEEVKEYCQENNIPIDCEYFYDHFQSNGWKVSGKTPMKDWKAAVRNWHRNQKKYSTVGNRSGGKTYDIPEL